MAVIDFPASPTVGQVFVAPNGATYKWTGVLWMVTGAGSGGATISVGPTPPASPSPNQLWFFNDGITGGGALYIYYYDGNTTQWVPASVLPSSAMPLSVFARIPTDIATGAAGAFANGPSTGLIGAAGEKWRVEAGMTLNCLPAAAGYMRARLWDGTTTYMQQDIFTSAGNNTYVGLCVIATLTGPTTFTAQGSMPASTTGTIVNTSWITAQRVS